jgi:hypothetical protein
MTLIYFLTDQPQESFRFFLFILIGTLTSFAAQSLGLLIGSLFSVQVSFLELILGYRFTVNSFFLDCTVSSRSLDGLKHPHWRLFHRR